MARFSPTYARRLTRSVTPSRHRNQLESRGCLPRPEPIPRPARCASFIDATSRGAVAMATLCDICHVRPATVRAEVVSNGQRETLNLCDVDYRRLARQQRSSSPLESLFGGRGSLFDDFFDDDGFFGRSAGRGRAPEEDEAGAAEGAARGGSSAGPARARGGAARQRRRGREPVRARDGDPAGGGAAHGRVRAARGRHRAPAAGAHRERRRPHHSGPVQGLARRSAPPGRAGDDARGRQEAPARR